MTVITDIHNDRRALGRDAASVLYAGAVATVAFDVFGQSLSPWFGFATLAPVALANQVLQTVFGQGFAPAAHLLHYSTGLLAYPLGWLLVAEPMANRFAPAMPWFLAAVAYGAALWVFALYVMAHLVGGNPAFLGFSGITWVALVGHVVFAVTAASVLHARGTTLLR